MCWCVSSVRECCCLLLLLFIIINNNIINYKGTQCNIYYIIQQHKFIIITFKLFSSPITIIHHAAKKERIGKI